MHSYNGTMVISLGLSCSSEGHIESLVRIYNLPVQQNSGFFDWTIISFDSIIQFFEHCKSGTVVEALANPKNYVRENPSGMTDYPKNTLFDCVYIWHTDNYSDKNFREKSTHKLNTLLNHKGKKYFIIDNTSRQLISNMQGVGEDHNKFLLTLDQHNKIKNLAKEIFDAEVIFVSEKHLTKDFLDDHVIRQNGIKIEELLQMFGL